MLFLPVKSMELSAPYYFPSYQAVQQALTKHPPSWERFLQLPISVRRELLDFCIGKHGLDILVRLSDGSYANVEMQKIGYYFPLARADCYASDIQKTNSDSLFPLQIFIKYTASF